MFGPEQAGAWAARAADCTENAAAHKPNFTGLAGGVMAGVYEIFVSGDFCAAHCLEGYDGPCARVHGHNWGVVAHVQCRELDATGMGLDFLAVKKALDQVVKPLDHADLNALPALAGTQPTAEALARFIFRSLSDLLNGPGTHVAKVTVTESKGFGASYWED